MTPKAERTRKHILETVAPVFTKKGYVSTSMTVIEHATGLSKGAIYGHFKTKEILAVEAFNYNIRELIWPLADQMNAKSSALKKLQALTDYYRTYYEGYCMQRGGCTILNVGVDAKSLNPALFDRVKVVIHKLKGGIIETILQGIQSGEIRPGINAEQYGNRIFSMIMGGIFSSTTLKSPEMLDDILDQIDIMIATELKL
ncbi:MAG: TetR/AcrR family transcriptional regulator [Bacteroidota bacterium]